MTESFLHYIWQFQYFKKDELRTSDGEILQIFKPGLRNSDAGPDFSEAIIKIADLEWRGSVEVHIKASGWNEHQHNTDRAYEKVVLHVVWENDKPILRADGSPMPTLELKNRVDLNLWNRYKKLFTSSESIPCSSSWNKVSDLTKLLMLDKAVATRLETKANSVRAILTSKVNDWEETCYQLVCKNFGFKVNSEAMLRLAEVLPYKILLKHLDKPYQIEALLFGQAGFLQKAKPDEYSTLLQREYKVLSAKYSLESKQLNEVQWRFLRLRPANFPTVRLAQLAALLVQQKGLFSKILEAKNHVDVMKLMQVNPSEYWRTHYQFGKKSKSLVPMLGKSSVDNLLINTVVPLLVAYGKMHDDQLIVDRAVELMQHVPAEKNKITRQWLDLGCKIKSAFDSQGYIELYNNFCLKRRCLDCSVGSSLVNKA